MGGAASTFLSSRHLLSDVLTALDGKTPAVAEEGGIKVRIPNNPALQGWGSAQPAAEWRGVSVDEGGVVAIDLSACNILVSSSEQAAALGNSLGRLSRLHTISLARNYLRDISVPTLGRLTKLDLSRNQIHQPLPSGLGKCRALRMICLANNR